MKTLKLPILTLLIGVISLISFICLALLSGHWLFLLVHLRNLYFLSFRAYELSQ